MSMELYERYLAEREEAFVVIDQVHQRNFSVTEEEVSDDVNEAIAALRSDQIVESN